MRVWTAIVALGAVAIAAGGAFLALGVHHTLGLGGLGLGGLLVAAGLGGTLLGRRGSGPQEKKTASVPAQKGAYRKALVAVLVIVVIGVGTFYAVTYVSSVAPAGPSTTTSSLSYSSSSSSSSGTELFESNGTLVSSTQSNQTTVQVSTVQITSTSLASCPTASTIAVDGSAINYLGYGKSASVLLSTSKSPDVIVVFATVASTSAGNASTPPSVPPSISGINDSAGLLSFHKRGAEVSSTYDTNADFVSEEEWYAVANSTLDNDTITVSIAPASSHLTVIAFGISGANTVSPFDSQLKDPVALTGTTVGEIAAPISTSHGYDLVIGAAAMGSYAPQPGPGFTLIQSDKGNAPIDDPIAEYEVVCVPLTSYGVTFAGEDLTGPDSYFNAAQPWIIMADAVVQASAGPAQTG